MRKLKLMAGVSLMVAALQCAADPADSSTTTTNTPPPAPPVAEGTIAAPVDISAGSLSGQTDDQADSFYVATGLVPGGSYTFVITAQSEAVNAFLYSDDFVTQKSSAQNVGVTDITLTTSAVTSSLYLKVSLTDPLNTTGARYTVTHSRIIATEGMATSPLIVDITDLPRESTAIGNSYYRIDNLKINDPYYSFTISGLSTDKDLYLLEWNTSYANSCGPVIGGISTAGTADEVFEYRPTATSVCVEVRQIGGGTFYNLDAVAFYKAEGSGWLPTAYPILTIGAVRNSMVDTTTSNYRFVPVAGTTYTATASGMANNIDLEVLNSAFGSLCSSTNAGTATESCSFTAPANYNPNEIYIKIKGDVGGDTSFDLVVN